MGEREEAERTGEGEQGERFLEFRGERTGDFKFIREGEVFFRNSLYYEIKSQTVLHGAERERERDRETRRERQRDREIEREKNERERGRERQRY